MRTYLKVVTVGLTLMAAYFLSRNYLFLEPSDIIILSGSWIQPKISSISQQVIDVRTGVILIILSFLFQIVDLSWPIRYKDMSVSRKGLFFALITLVIIGFIFCHINNKFEDNFYNEILKYKQEAEMSRRIN